MPTLAGSSASRSSRQGGFLVWTKIAGAVVLVSFYGFVTGNMPLNMKVSKLEKFKFCARSKGNCSGGEKCRFFFKWNTHVLTSIKIVLSY